MKRKINFFAVKISAFAVKRSVNAVPAIRHIFYIFFIFLALSCEIIDDDLDKHWLEDETVDINLKEVAHMLSSLPLTAEQMGEVQDAVSSSSTNGYDEEYMMLDLFEIPGKGVGEAETKTDRKVYETPLRDMIVAYVSQQAKSSQQTKSSCPCDMNFLNDLMKSDVQIYWPYSEDWDGETLPVITFDPDNGSDTNLGYKIVYKNGEHQVEEIVVDEEIAMKRPVWVVNNNDDSSHKTLEVLRREGHFIEGGDIIIKPKLSPVQTFVKGNSVQGDSKPLRTLLLKDFTMNRHYDPWFAGASEFFVKIGAVENFTASTEAELKLYVPTVTDFMIVVRRKNLGKKLPFNAILVSDWTEQMTDCAFLIVEDDGGKKTSWNATALVRVASKSYGIEISLPFNQYDDIVWRGQLSARFLTSTRNTVGHFGDIDLTFEFKEY